jgi:hypothetical protein
VFSLAFPPFIASASSAATPGSLAMPIIPRLTELQPELARIRRDIHAHPELGFE